LEINLADDVAAVLRDMAEDKEISVTETVRRAIAVLHFTYTEIAAGNRLAVIDGPDGRIREVVLVGGDPELQP
jgi:hypothetical protein